MMLYVDMLTPCIKIRFSEVLFILLFQELSYIYELIGALTHSHIFHLTSANDGKMVFYFRESHKIGFIERNLSQVRLSVLLQRSGGI